MSAKLSISQKRRQRTKSAKGKGNGLRSSKLPLISVLIGLLVWACTLQILSIGRSLKFASLAAGQRAPVTVLAKVDFRAVDHNETALRRGAAATEALPVFSVSDEGRRMGMQTVDRLFDRLDIVYKTHTNETLSPEVVKDLDDDIDLLGLQLDAQILTAIVKPANLESVRSAISQSIETIWNLGVISNGDKSSGFNGRVHAGRINLMSGETTETQVLQSVAIDTIKIPAEATAAIMAATASRLEGAPGVNQIVPPLVNGWLIPNLDYEGEKSEEMRLVASEKVRPVYQQIREGATLMVAGSVVDEQTLELLRLHEVQVSESEQSFEVFLTVFRYAIMLFALLLVTGAIMHIVLPSLLRDQKQLILLGLLVLIPVAASKVLLYCASALEWIDPTLVMYWIPFAMSAVLATILVGSKFAIPVIVFNSFSVALAMDSSFSVLLFGLLAGFTASLSTREIHKRSNVFRAGLFVGVVQMMFALLIGLIHQTPWQVLSLQALVAFGTGPVLALLCLLLIPLFETSFKITTDIRLLELSDMSHPLLQRLALEAPGTYHHSLMVASLASSAANEIGANDLLIRVCAYYHDIGKMVKPEFFIENIPYKNNPHDDLSPSMSTLVIISHVKEGLSLAAHHNLPPIIIAGIEQHHGTSKIAYFYHRAMEQAKEEEEQQQQQVGDKKKKKKSATSKVREEDFRYPGPKPKTVEMGILLLADAIEAASRSIDKPSPSNIDSLVTEIINEKVKDGQLDDSGMNFTQLAAIKKSFIYNLNNMLHGRIAYPKGKDKDEDRDQQPSEPIPAGSTQAGETRPALHAAGTKTGSGI